MSNPKTSIIGSLLLLMLACGSAVAEPLSIAEFKQQINDLAGQTAALDQNPEDAAKLLASIPDRVIVRVHSRDYPVSYQWLKEELAKYPKAEATTRKQILQTIEEHFRALESASQELESNSTDLEQSRKKLDEILSRHEFHKVKGPSAWAIFWSRVWRALFRLLRVRIRRLPGLDFLQIVIYSLIAAAVVAVAIWVIRRLGRNQEETLGRDTGFFTPSEKGWGVWLAEARSLAQKGDWRNSIHLAYWAAISFLEANGAWKPDFARTPREYLQLLSTRAPHYPVLRRLTRKFEVVWYGHRDAGEADFQEILGQLEQLGCR
ncbi:MAG TPA: DUF4129 domain-containing protein [Candidatus Angelobacter sp.]|jgi:hypothetical protein|nr:DUF4129 domain-containing protein [Candidatus Angelobacter sp.]